MAKIDRIQIILWLSALLVLQCLLCMFGLKIDKAFDLYAVKDAYYHTQSGDIVSVVNKDPVENVVGLKLPVKSVAEVSSWAARVAVAVFSVDFYNYPDQYQKIREYFTDSGWEAMQEAIFGSGWLSNLVDKKLSATAVLTGMPIVSLRGILDGVYAWRITFPVLVTYESASETKQERRFFTMVVKRVAADFKKGQVGIAVDSLVTSI